MNNNEKDYQEKIENKGKWSRVLIVISCKLQIAVLLVKIFWLHRIINFKKFLKYDFA